MDNAGLTCREERRRDRCARPTSMVSTSSRSARTTDLVTFLGKPAEHRTRKRQDQRRPPRPRHRRHRPSRRSPERSHVRRPPRGDRRQTRRLLDLPPEAGEARRGRQPDRCAIRRFRSPLCIGRFLLQGGLPERSRLQGRSGLPTGDRSGARVNHSLHCQSFRQLIPDRPALIMPDWRERHSGYRTCWSSSPMSAIS